MVITITLRTITGLTVLRLRCTAHHSSVSIASLVARAAMMTRGCGKLGIPRVNLVASALPEWSSAGTGGVIVGWGRAIALFLLVVSD